MARDLRRAAGRPQALLRAVRGALRARSRCSARASTSRSAAPIRSTRSSTSISPPAASASRARRPSRSPASPMRWAGARSAGSPRRSPRTWISRPRTSTASAASGPRRAMATKPGLKAVDLFRAIGEGRIKALWVMATNPAVSMPDAGRGARGAGRLPVRRRVRLHRRHRHRALRPCPPARRRLGREGRHGHQFANARSAASARCSAAARRGASPTGGSSRRSPARMGWRDAFAYDRPADIYREHARLSAYQQRRRAPVRPRRARRDRQRRLRRDGAVPLGRRRPSPTAASPTPDGKARLVAGRAAPLAGAARATGR